MRTGRQLSIVSVLVGTAVCFSQQAHAIDKCKVKVDKKTGVIAVSASGVTGPLVWGTEAGAESQSFFDSSECLQSGTAKSCHLADPATLASKTSPEGCTIYLNDSSAPCSVWIAGCSPGVRATSPSLDGHSAVWLDADGDSFGAFATVEAGEKVVLLKAGSTTYLARLMQGGSTYTWRKGGLYKFASMDCTGQPYSTPTPQYFGNIAPILSVLPTGGYYFPSNAASVSFNSSLFMGDYPLTQAFCDSNFPGSSFVAPQGCCEVVAGGNGLSTGVPVDISGITEPFHLEVE